MKNNVKGDIEEQWKIAKIKSDVVADLMAKEAQSQENYDKAVGYYEKAKSELKPEEILQDYLEALKYAQFSLGQEQLDPLKNAEINSIIENSRSEINKYSEQIEREKKMEMLKRGAREYAEKASYDYSRDARSAARWYFSLALQYYGDALNYADQEKDKEYIEYEMTRIREEMENIRPVTIEIRRRY